MALLIGVVVCYVLDYSALWYVFLAISVFVVCEVYYSLYRTILAVTEGHFTMGITKDLIPSYYRAFLRMLCPILAIVMAWVFFFYVLIPSFIHVTYDLCDCPLEGLINSPQQEYICSIPAKMACTVGFCLVWTSSILVSLVVLYASFVGLMLIIGVIEGKRNNIGTFSTWADMNSRVWAEIMEFSQKYYGEDGWPKMWSAFVDSLVNDWLITVNEATLLRMQNFDKPPENREARRRILSFANSLHSLFQGGIIQLLPDDMNVKQLFQQMPSLSILIPHYSEPVVFATDYLRETSRPFPTLSTSFRRTRTNGRTFVNWRFSLCENNQTSNLNGE
jgi:hypothetical protein